MVWWAKETELEMANSGSLNKENQSCVVAHSKYEIECDSVARERYERKLKLFNGGFLVPNPYGIKESEWSLDMTKWPPIEYGDLYNHFINTPGIYTKEALKAFKSLEGYDYFVSGHVQEVFLYEISPDSPVALLKGRVKPSQGLNDDPHKPTQNDDPHKPWILVDRHSGYIIAAHCTCKAGQVIYSYYECIEKLVMSANKRY